MKHISCPYVNFESHFILYSTGETELKEFGYFVFYGKGNWCIQLPELDSTLAHDMRLKSVFLGHMWFEKKFSDGLPTPHQFRDVSRSSAAFLEF